MHIGNNIYNYVLDLVIKHKTDGRMDVIFNDDSIQILACGHVFGMLLFRDNQLHFVIPFLRHDSYNYADPDVDLEQVIIEFLHTINLNCE